jgi:hypothetical protein
MMMNSAQNMMGPKPSGNPPLSSNNQKGQLRGPTGVDDILNMVNRPKVPLNMPKEDTISSVSTQGSAEKRKIRMKKQPTRLNFQ